MYDTVAHALAARPSPRFEHPVGAQHWPVPAELARAGVRAGAGQLSDDSWVLLQLRLPRVLAALVVGAALASAGATYQGMFRNPLVSPDILGVAAGRAWRGAGHFLSLSLIWVQLFAFVGGLVAVFWCISFAMLVTRHDAILVLVLAGVALSALLGAAISMFKLLADPYNQLPSITFWLMGGLNALTLNDLLFVAPFMLLALLPLWLLRWRINLCHSVTTKRRHWG